MPYYVSCEKNIVPISTSFIMTNTIGQEFLLQFLCMAPFTIMDYSENMSQMYKFEIQSTHFNKRNYSLHCTVEHVDETLDSSKSPYLPLSFV